MTPEDVAKICPSCKQQDVTSFSKCRFCGTRYDAIIVEKKGLGVDQQFLIGIGVAGLLGLLFMFINGNIQQAKAKRMAPITAEIRSAHRPRVLEFYANWCGPCRNYGPVIENCQAKYSGQVDFQRLNVDDPQSRPLAQAVGVSSIPLTCMFDRNGNEVAHLVGGRSPEELDNYMQKLLSAN